MKARSVAIRPAVPGDLAGMLGCDPQAAHGERRADYLRRALAEWQCVVAAGEAIVGFGVMNETFFENGFVSLLVVHPDWRRCGIGKALMRHLEESCRTSKLFTSTNLSNLPMQVLLRRAGYKLSGIVDDLDEGDPELFYVKYLR